MQLSLATKEMERKMGLQKVLRQGIPPFVLELGKKLLNLVWPAENRALFDGDDELFKNLVSKVDVYGEYGLGQSTIWISRNTLADIYSVDTSIGWINMVKKRVGNNLRLGAEWVDMGELGSWGTPKKYPSRRVIESYIGSIWEREKQPELILIDGRFRVACFFKSILSGAPGTRILFDDYVNRPKYHIVEEYIARESTCGRQGLFVVPEEKNFVELEEKIQQFLYVMD